MAQAPAKKAKSKDKEKSPKLPPTIQDIRDNVTVGSKSVKHGSAIEDPNAFAALGVDNTFSLEDFRSNFRVDVIESTSDHIIFDMVGIGAPIANAIRRILLAEVPTMAIEKVNLYQNTSIIQDEVLAHRLGLIPILADPRKFKYVDESDGVQNEENTIVFVLQVSCTINSKAPETAAAVDKYVNSVVYSSSLKWIPQGSQAEKFAAAPIRAVYDDIIVAKLRPGQSIEAELLAEKGVGKAHAKWSPVATASYRLLPSISFTEPIEGDAAEELVNKCPAEVFDIEDLGMTKRAIVARPRSCTMCRECVREPEWERRVQLRRVRDHYIFSVETTGAYKPAEVVTEAIKVLKTKCQTVLSELP